MSDTLTPERIAELRAIAAAVHKDSELYSAEVNEFVLAFSPPKCLALLNAAEERDVLRVERDAYKKAKSENDERFMLERDQARAERDAALAENARLQSECDGVFTEYKLAQEAYHRCDKGIATLQAENARLRDLLTRVKRVLPPGELYEAILNALHEEETP